MTAFCIFAALAEAVRFLAVHMCVWVLPPELSGWVRLASSSVHDGGRCMSSHHLKQTFSASRRYDVHTPRRQAVCILHAGAVALTTRADESGLANQSHTRALHNADHNAEGPQCGEPAGGTLGPVVRLATRSTHPPCLTTCANTQVTEVHLIARNLQGPTVKQCGKQRRQSLLASASPVRQGLCHA